MQGLHGNSYFRGKRISSVLAMAGFALKGRTPDDPDNSRSLDTALPLHL